MNIYETEKLLTVIQKLYPNHFKEFDAEVFELQAKLWQRAFVDYSYQDCATAFEIWFNTEVFPPMPVNLKKILIRITKPHASISSEKAWEVVDSAVRKFGSYNQEKAFKTFSEPIKRAVRNVGGWQKICMTELGREWDFLRKNFMEAYNDIDQEVKEQETLPSPVLKRIQELSEKRQRLEQPKQETAKSLNEL